MAFKAFRAARRAASLATDLFFFLLLPGVEVPERDASFAVLRDVPLKILLSNAAFWLLLVILPLFFFFFLIFFFFFLAASASIACTLRPAYAGFSEDSADLALLASDLGALREEDEEDETKDEAAPDGVAFICDHASSTF